MVGTKRNRWLPTLFVGLLLLFFYIPIISLMVFSFNSSRSLTSWSGFSLKWYALLFQDREMMSAVYTTLIIALISTMVATFVGTITAIGLSKTRRLIKETVLTVNNFPILNPEIVTAIGLMLLFGFALNYAITAVQPLMPESYPTQIRNIY